MADFVRLTVVNYLKVFMKYSLPALLLFSTFTVQAAPSQTDRAQLEQVVETFRLSLINKDKASFMKLLFSETIPWSVAAGAHHARLEDQFCDLVDGIQPGKAAEKSAMSQDGKQGASHGKAYRMEARRPGQPQAA